MEADPLLHPIVKTEASRKTERLKRRDHFVRETIVSGAVAEYEQNGWEIDRKLKIKVRVKKPKAQDENFENRVWLLFEQLGFEELNQGRHFKVRFNRGGKTGGEKQIDVFAKDDDTVVVIECKTSRALKKKSLQKDIEEFANLKKKIANSVRSHYGRSFKPKIIWALATNNIIWSDADRARADGENIHVITEKELRYFLELSGHLGPAGKYQFLAHFLQGQKIPNLDGLKVPAIRGKLGGHDFYAFVATPEQLLKISFVNHRTLNDPRSAPSYQRLISKNRMKKIQGFLLDGGFFPTNIILNFSKKPRCEIREKNELFGIQFVNMYLPSSYKSAWVIDGQHRLYSFAALDDLRKTESVFVIAFDGISKEEEANLFVEINHEQKSVPKTLLDDLKGELDWGSQDPKSRISAICSRLINTLNNDQGEPFFERVVPAGLRATGQDGTLCLNLPQLKEGLERSKLIGFVHPKLKTYYPGPFAGVDDYETLERGREVSNLVFSSLRDANPLIWDTGPDAGLCRNTSIQALFLIMAQAIEHYKVETSNDPLQLSSPELAEAVLDFLGPLTKLLENGDRDEIRALFRDGVPHGSSGQKQLFLKIVDLVREEFPSFGPAEFEEWKQAQDTERANEAITKVQDLNKMICASLFRLMEDKYGAEYFDKALPDKKARAHAYEKSLDDPVETRGKLEEYLDLITYKKIVEKREHWPDCKKIFDIPLEEDKGAAKHVKWMERLNEIRKRTTHQTAGRPLSLEQIEFVEEIHEQFSENLAAYEENGEMVNEAENATVS